MQASLAMFKTDGTRKDFPLRKPRVVVGRTSQCDLRIPLSSVSRRHCELAVEGEQLRLRDLGSSNGTYHNDQRVQEASLSPGDRVVVGPVVFTVVVDGTPERIDPVPSVVDGSEPVSSAEEAAAAGEALSEPELAIAEDSVTAAAMDEIEVAPLPSDGAQASREEAEPVVEAIVDDADQSSETPIELTVADDGELPVFDEEAHTPTVDLDDPIAALEALAQADDNGAGDDTPVFDDDDEDKK